MVRRILAAIPFALLSLAIPATAQTYPLDKQYPCIGEETHYPYVPGVFCEGMVPYGAAQVEVQFNLSGRFEMSKPFQINLYCYDADGNVQHATEHTTSYTAAKFDGTPGTFTFDWQGYDVVLSSDPLHNPSCVNFHHGTASGIWTIGGPNWRGWYWSVLDLGSTFTIVQ